MATTKKKKKKKITRNMLDALYSKIVRTRAGNRCEYDGCGSTGSCQCHHIFGRVNYSVRWYLDNGICLCATHHKFGKWSAHQSPLWFGNWLMKTRGKKWYEDLSFKAKQYYKADYEKIYTYLKSIADKLAI